MMRSLFSGVSGLRVHQTKMDVIGNNIANVNTVGYKASRVTFNEVFSQKVGGASAANPDTGRGGVNPRQIGLGAGVASIDKLMTTGASQRTDNPFDLMIQGEGFFIVGDGSGTYFTRAGVLNVDAAGNIVNSNGLQVMGWNEVDENGKVVQGIVKPLTISGEKEYVTPKVTTQIDFKGNLNAANNTATAKIMSMTFFDSVGNSYVVDASMKYVPAQKAGFQTDSAGNFVDASGNMVTLTTNSPSGPTEFVVTDKTTGVAAAPVATDPRVPTPASDGYWTYSIIPVAYPNGKRDQGVMIEVDPTDCSISFTQTKAADVSNHDPVMLGIVTFNTNGLPTGFISANNVDATTNFKTDPLTGLPIVDPDLFPVDITNTTYTPLTTLTAGGSSVANKANQFALTIKNDPTQPNELIPAADFGFNVDTINGQVKNSLIVDFSGLTQFGGQTSDATSSPKDGNAPGTLSGISIGTDGTIMGRYSNGQTKVLGQIPVAVFKNPAGLEKVGDNLFVPTANSGDFDGVGSDVAGSGGSMLGGVLEMSNVDLSAEFTEMITTQRGFQANSRVITTSDDMLQELVNLKR